MRLSYTVFLRTLYESVDGLSPYAFHVKFKVSPYEVSSLFVDAFQKGFVSFDPSIMKISLTDIGKEEAKRTYFLKIREKKHEAVVPGIFLAPPKELNASEIQSIKPEDYIIKRRERTSIEETSRFRFRVKAE